MDDALLMRCLQSIHNLQSQVHQIIGREAGSFLTCKTVPEGLSLQQLHNDEGLPLVLFNLVDRADVGVVQRGRGAGFALETLQRLGTVRQLLRQEL